MKLLVLAGGYGTRLRSLGFDVPKALVPVGSVPFLALQIQNWIDQGINSFTFLLHHQSDQVIDFLNGAKGGLLNDCDVSSVVEPSPLGTGGAVAFAARELTLRDDFFVANADTWLSSGLAQLNNTPAPALAVTAVSDSGRYGKVNIDKDGKVTGFEEKSSQGRAGSINAGLYRLNAQIFDDWDGSGFSLEKKTFPELISRGQLRSVLINSDFIDIGVPEDYQRFCRWISEGRETML